MFSSAYDVAFWYSQGQISREEMLFRLINWDYPAEVKRDTTEWQTTPNWTEGSFSATVGRAYDQKLITGYDYDEILDAVADDLT